MGQDQDGLGGLPLVRGLTKRRADCVRVCCSTVAHNGVEDIVRVASRCVQNVVDEVPVAVYRDIQVVVWSRDVDGDKIIFALMLGVTTGCHQ